MYCTGCGKDKPRSEFVTDYRICRTCYKKWVRRYSRIESGEGIPRWRRPYIDIKDRISMLKRAVSIRRRIMKEEAVLVSLDYSPVSTPSKIAERVLSGEIGKGYRMCIACGKTFHTSEKYCKKQNGRSLCGRCGKIARDKRLIAKPLSDKPDARIKPRPSREEVYDAYVTQQRSVEEMCEMFNLGRTTLFYVIKDYDIVKPAKPTILCRVCGIEADNKTHQLCRKHYNQLVVKPNLQRVAV